MQNKYLEARQLFRDLDSAIKNVSQHSDILFFESINEKKHQKLLHDAAFLALLHEVMYKEKPALLLDRLKNIKTSNKPGRKQSGSYFTPVYIAKYMVKSTINMLIADIKKDEKIKDKIKKISELKILDPCCGGAIFLICAHDNLVINMMLLNRAEKKYTNEQMSHMALFCLFGIDINPNAVEISKILLNLNHLKWLLWKEKLLDFVSSVEYSSILQNLK